MNQSSRIEFPNLFQNDIIINRIAFTLFGIDVYWYGIIITGGVILAVVYALQNAHRVGVLSDKVFDLAFWGTICGIVGARLYYVIFWNLNPENEYKYDLLRTFTGIRDGGLAIYGGVIGGVVGAIVVSRLMKIKLLPVIDLAGLGFLIGHCIGRWGNFVNQEAFGAPTASELPWGMTGDRIMADLHAQGADPNALVHPCFLYESLWCLLGFIVLHFYLRKWRTFDGEIFLMYVVWYGTGRAFIEELRTDSLYAGGLKVSQVLAIASAAFAAILFVYFKMQLQKKKEYVMYAETEESKKLIEEYQYKIKLREEQEKAKTALRRTQRELGEPTAPTIIQSEEDENGENS
ncbi:MAG: prolipoprotein diacylglyceryl transferase [Oscillospiraceae bacterium]|nr:prolipoprotein diacylglyceryl transferase [Oscillospiraceae bacterium]